MTQPEDEDGFPLVEEDDEDRFMFGRKGDHLMSPFQCDLCHFRNIHQRDPSRSLKDERLLVFIRRANLDALWSREPGTVYGNLGEARRMAQAAATMGIPSLPMVSESMPVRDSFGMVPAILLLCRSLDKGRTRDTVQFNTCRKTRSVWSNCAHAYSGAGDGAVMGSDGRQMHMSSSSTNTLWHGKFFEGCHRRMGDQPVPDRAIQIDELHLVLEYLDSEYLKVELQAENEPRKNARKTLRKEQTNLACAGLFVTGGFLGGLRGEEVLLMELSGVRTHYASGLLWTPPHVLLPLMGRFKGETGERHYLVAVVPNSKSGINVGLWMDRMIKCHQNNKKYNGWVFPREVGEGRAKISDFDPLFHEALRDVQSKRPDLIKGDVEVGDVFSLRRSLRRGSTTHARNMKVPEENIEFNNGWRKSQRAKAKAPSLSMVQHYTDVKLALPYVLRYSENL